MKISSNPEPDVENARLWMRLATVAETCRANPWLKVGTVRSWLQENPGSFREDVVFQIGGRIFLNLDRLEEWLERQSKDARDDD